jgi:Spy/CpxP family protein refolding chaperone
MTTKTKLWMGGVAALALVALALPSLVTAQYQGGRGHGKPSTIDATQDGGLDQEDAIFVAGPAWMEALELTEEQSLQLDALRLQFQQEQLRTRGQLAASQAELDALLLDPEASRSAVESAGDAVQELRGKVQAQRLEHQMDVRELLTAEQRTLLVQMKARGIAGRGSRGGRGFGLHQGGGHGRPGFGMHAGGGPCGERMSRRGPARLHQRHRLQMDAPVGPEPDVEVESEQL